MAEQVQVTFLYAMGQQVCYAVDASRRYTVVGRTYEERAIMSPIIMYRLARSDGVYLDSAYEPDLAPWEGD